MATGTCDLSDGSRTTPLEPLKCCPAAPRTAPGTHTRTLGAPQRVPEVAQQPLGARRRAIRAARVTASAALTLGAGLVAASCRSSPPLLADASTGRWVNPMGVALDLAPTGIFTLEVPGKPVAVGRIAVLEGEGTFRFQNGSAFCPEEPGVYRINADDGTLQLSLVRDTCAERTEAFARPFARPSR